ncbi:hypothetical protein CPB83DRAFT_895844 [Crepidotus variabilis]|uniref:Uncharacterized protein n=1 Tax=Crepidotus variabilis TaxID=179855 RepID=A0A9P6JN65_9AGAR|nr:hypothetical protein CPB83DRAFT_895844 [Crepidotus variabilis]
MNPTSLPSSVYSTKGEVLVNPEALSNLTTTLSSMPNSFLNDFNQLAAFSAANPPGPSSVETTLQQVLKELAAVKGELQSIRQEAICHKEHYPLSSQLYYPILGPAAELNTHYLSCHFNQRQIQKAWQNVPNITLQLSSCQTFFEHEVHDAPIRYIVGQPFWQDKANILCLPIMRGDIVDVSNIPPSSRYLKTFKFFVECSQQNENGYSLVRLAAYNEHGFCANTLDATYGN